MAFFYPPYIPKSFYTNPYKQNSNADDHKNGSIPNREKEKSSSYSSFGPVRFKNPLFDDDINEPIFEVFGTELYLDDIIIIGLLFLLYNEGVQDEFLYITLILLLIS